MSRAPLFNPDQRDVDTQLVHITVKHTLTVDPHSSFQEQDEGDEDDDDEGDVDTNVSIIQSFYDLISAPVGFILEFCVVFF